ncbi:MAG TPA: hypothetical protein VMF30_07095 [Pirellulales bacterium]|nr:hypothetical protein [Pirellulales bacterium]
MSEQIRRRAGCFLTLMLVPLGPVFVETAPMGYMSAFLALPIFCQVIETARESDRVVLCDEAIEKQENRKDACRVLGEQAGRPSPRVFLFVCRQQQRATVPTDDDLGPHGSLGMVLTYHHLDRKQFLHALDWLPFAKLQGKEPDSAKSKQSERIA